MSVFFYREKNTLLHALDPQTKLALLASLFVVVAVVNNTAALSGLAVGTILLFIAARSLESLSRMAAVLLTIGITTFLLWFALNHGAARPVMFAAAMSLRFIDLLLAGLLFLSITSIEEFSHGLMLFRVPYPMAFGLSLSFRLVIVFVATGFTIVEAQKVRGNDVTKGSLAKRIRSYAPLLVPLILSGVKKAETLTLALESKGFSPDNKIKVGDRYAMKPADWLLSGIAVAAVVAAVIAKIKHLL